MSEGVAVAAFVVDVTVPPRGVADEVAEVGATVAEVGVPPEVVTVDPLGVTPLGKVLGEYNLYQSVGDEVVVLSEAVAVEGGGGGGAGGGGAGGGADGVEVFAFGSAAGGITGVVAGGVVGRAADDGAAKRVGEAAFAT